MLCWFDLLLLYVFAYLGCWVDGFGFFVLVVCFRVLISFDLIFCAMCYEFCSWCNLVDVYVVLLCLLFKCLVYLIAVVLDFVGRLVLVVVLGLLFGLGFIVLRLFIACWLRIVVCYCVGFAVFA